MKSEKNKGDVSKYKLAVAAYRDWCQAEGVVFEQPSEALSEAPSELDGNFVILRNINGDLGTFVVCGDEAKMFGEWTPVEKAMFAAGDAIQAFMKDQPFASDDELEVAVWEPKLQEKISQEAFREVCRNLRHGFSPLGDD